MAKVQIRGFGVRLIRIPHTLHLASRTSNFTRCLPSRSLIVRYGGWGPYCRRNSCGDLPSDVRQGYGDPFAVFAAPPGSHPPTPFRHDRGHPRTISKCLDHNEHLICLQPASTGGPTRFLHNPPCRWPDVGSSCYLDIHDSNN